MEVPSSLLQLQVCAVVTAAIAHFQFSIALALQLRERAHIFRSNHETGIVADFLYLVVAIRFRRSESWAEQYLQRFYYTSDFFDRPPWPLPIFPWYLHDLGPTPFKNHHKQIQGHGSNLNCILNVIRQLQTLWQKHFSENRTKTQQKLRDRHVNNLATHSIGTWQLDQSALS